MEEKANKILIANIPIPANTEVSWALPKGCVWFTLQCRTAVDVRIAFESGKMEDRYLTLKSGTSWDEHDLDIRQRQPIYFYAASAVVVEAFLGISEEEEIT